MIAKRIDTTGTILSLNDTLEDNLDIKLEGNTSQETTALPSEYQQVEYIQSSGTQYIDTGVQPCMNKIRCVCDMIPLTTTDTAFFGSRGTYYLFYNIGNNYFWPISKCETIQGTLSVGNKYHIDWNKGTFEITGTDGVYEKGVRSNNTQDTRNMYIFNFNPVDNRGTSAKLYNFKIYVQDVLTRDFIPCYRISDNEVGLYDLVSNTFFTNSGTGTFDKGSNIYPPSPLYPREINVVSGDNTIKIINKNLYDGIFRQGGSLNTTSTNRLFTQNDFEIKGGVSYTISTTMDLTTYRYAINMSQQQFPVGAFSNIFYDSGWKTTASFTFTPTQDGHIGIIISKQSNEDLTPSDISSALWQLEIGNQATEYKPYTIQEKEIDFRGKNKCNGLFEVGTINGTTGANTSTTNRLRSIDYINVNSLTKYTLNATNNQSRTLQCFVFEYNEYNNFIQRIPSAWTSLPYTFTTSSTTKKIRVVFRFSDEETMNVSYVENTQLELGETATTFEAYNSIELCKIGDYKDSIFYNKTDTNLDLNAWYIKKNIGKLILNGTETNWNRTARDDYYAYWFRNTAIGALPQKHFKYCDKFIYNSSGYGQAPTPSLCENDATSNPDNFMFIFKTDGTQGTTLNDWETWLSNNNTIVYYVLNTPTYTKITDETLIGQIEELKNTTSFNEQTNIEQINNDALFNLNVNYPERPSSFIEECKNGAYCNRYGKLEFNGLTINEANQLVDFSIESGCYDNGDIIGNTYVKKIDSNLLDSLDDNLIDEDFEAYVGAKYLVEDVETTEYLDLGKYTVENPTDTQTENRTSFVGYDKLLDNLENAYSTELDYENDTITIRDVYLELCDNLGLIPVNTIFTNSTITVEGNPFTNGEKNRDVLKTIEKVSCSFVDIDPNTNKIKLKWLSNNLDYTFEKSDYSTLEGGKVEYGPINTLIIRGTEVESENVSISDAESIAEYGEHPFTIIDDYFLYNADKRQAALNTIWEKVHGLKYVDCKLTSLTGKPFLTVGDKIRVITGENEYFDTYILKHKFTYNGAFMSEIESPVLTQQETKTKQDISLGEKLRNTQIIVNKQNGEIQAIASRTETIDTTVGNNYIELNSKFDNYTPTSRTVEIENRVTTLQTDTYTKTQIDTKLTDGSVTKVMTASGTFDIDGMHYEKTNAPTSTTINEVGVGVNKTNDSNYLLFAGYVDDNNTQYSDFKGQTIVASENMLVENYFVIGSKSRMEDYEDGTGVFYIGG